MIDVICTKSYTYKVNDNDIRTFTEGKIYKIKTFERDGVYAEFERDGVYIESDNHYNVLYFTYKEAALNAKNFNDYFITLAKWRELQINEILNGDIL